MISVSQYNDLTEAAKKDYVPVYGKYKTTKHRDYQECDLGHTHYMGWREVRTPLGDPVSYREKSTMEKMNDVILPNLVDQVIYSNILSTAIFNDKRGDSKTVSFRRHGAEQ